MNSELRTKIIASSGFCNRHSHVIHKGGPNAKAEENFGDSATAQIVLKKLEDDLTALLTSLKGAKGRSEPGSGGSLSEIVGKLEKTINGESICPVCEKLLRSDKERIASLLQMLESKGTADLYEKSDALCLPHFVSTMRLLPASPLKNAEGVWSLLVKSELVRLGSVNNVLEERMKKYSWDFRNEGITPEEANSQKTGMLLITGVEGLYCRPRKTSLRPAREEKE